MSERERVALLLPCPFCGGEASLNRGPLREAFGDWERVKCGKCEAQFSCEGKPRWSAAVMWNTRAERTNGSRS